MAWTERLSSGKWRGGWRDPAGKKCYTRRPDFPEHPYARKRDALEAAQEAEVNARRRAAVEQGAVSASITFEEWWGHVQPTIEHTAGGISSRSIARRYLIPKWGSTPLNEITQRAVKAWVADLTPKREPSYVHRIVAEFRRAINHALESDPPVLHASPCAGVKLPTVRRKSRRYMDDDDLAPLLLRVGDKDLPALHPRYQALVRVALLTGLRPGEMCGLHADAVDLDGGWVEVRCVYVDRMGVIRGYPKDKDVRQVPLVDTAIAIIREQLAGRDLTAGCGVEHVDGSRCGGPLVFRNARGGVATPDGWALAMKLAAARAGVPRRSPYDCRRGFATAAARGGMDAFELAELLGHADVRQTREYVQRSPAARSRLSAALGERRGLQVVRDRNAS